VTERRTFENSPDVVADARRFVTERLGEVSPELTRIAGLMVSELATNCVRHTTSDFTVEMERTAREICVRVSDRGQGMPVIRSPDTTDPSGRGLHLVDELADSFGVDYDAARLAGDGTGTKTVWFVVRLDAAEQPEEFGSTAGRPAESEVAARPESESRTRRAERGEAEPPGFVSEERQRAKESGERRERFQYRCTCHSFLTADTTCTTLPRSVRAETRDCRSRRTGTSAAHDAKGV
jgi:anti-sigma regulatory factor (Ser/Thr protein kinase)